MDKQIPRIYIHRPSEIYISISTDLLINYKMSFISTLSLCEKS